MSIQESWCACVLLGGVAGDLECKNKDLRLAFDDAVRSRCETLLSMFLSGTCLESGMNVYVYVGIEADLM